MIRPLPRAYILASAILLCFCFASCDNKSEELLQSELNNSGWNLVNPANNWTYAGGIVVQDSKNASFYGLPQGTSALPTGPIPPPGATWGQSTASGSFSVQALINGIGKVLGSSIQAGVSVNHSSQETVQKINASGTCVQVGPQCGMDVQALLSQPLVSNQIKLWLQNKNPEYAVFVVTKVLTTTNLSVSTSSSSGVDAALGSLQQCPSSNGTPNPTPAGGATGAGGTGGGATGATGAGGTGNTQTGSTNATGTNTSTGNSPTASLQFCQNSSSQFSMSTSSPLVFAAETVPVTLDSGGNLQAGPIAVHHGGFMALTAPATGPTSPPPPQAKVFQGRWQQKSWP